MARNKYNVDETLETEFNIQHLKRSFVYIKRYKKWFFGAFFFSMISIICGLVMPLFTAHAIDEQIPARDIKGLIIAGVSIVIIVIIQAFCNRYRSRCSAQAGQAIIRDIRRDLYVHRFPAARQDPCACCQLRELGLRFFDKRNPEHHPAGAFSDHYFDLYDRAEP